MENREKFSALIKDLAENKEGWKNDLWTILANMDNLNDNGYHEQIINLPNLLDARNDLYRTDSSDIFMKGVGNHLYFKSSSHIMDTYGDGMYQYVVDTLQAEEKDTDKVGKYEEKLAEKYADLMDSYNAETQEEPNYIYALYGVLEDGFILEALNDSMGKTKELENNKDKEEEIERD